MAEPTYLARELGQIERGPGIWNGVQVGVFRVQDGREERIGEYSRNYGTNFACFHPFRRNGADFALYSPDYTVTRVLELPSCRDLGGEERDAGGFCPVDYHVPRFIRQEFRSDDLPEPYVSTIWQPKDSDLEPRTLRYPGPAGRMIESTYRPLGPLTYVPYGFVAGCVWGDDSSWKIQYLDLSQAHRGIVKRDDRFGYVELPDALSLADAVRIEDGDSEDPWVHLSVRQTFRLSGRRPSADD